MSASPYPEGEAGLDEPDAVPQGPGTGGVAGPKKRPHPPTEIGRRTQVVGTFPDGKSALMLVAARLRNVADSEWGSRRYLDTSLLKE